jgi:sec-independent protein translocase protein TatC
MAEENQEAKSQLDKLEEQEAHSMGWLEHLEELRDRLFAAGAFWLIATFACYFFSEKILNFLKKPLMDVLPDDKKELYFTSIFENFITHLKVAGYGGVVLAAPFILYQVWKFIEPGLYRHEKKLAAPFVLASTLFFVGGVAFAYVYVFPAAFEFLINFGNAEETRAIITVSNYFGAALKMMFVFGLVFELPVVLVLLGVMGIIESGLLARNRRWAIMIMAIACAFLSPPDLFSMLFMMGPVYLFYEVSIWIIRGLEKAKGKTTS